MNVRDLYSMPIKSMDQIQENVSQDRKRVLSRDLPVNATLLALSVPIHIKARTANLTDQTVESGVIVIASAFFMLVFALSTLVLAVALWSSRPNAQQEK
ncbi:MAG: hypothetical protein HC851_18620 [Acaryochloris sp. RU_4_1]|nr:hypothetical protein [Acaryochloris sp. RU_4_1]NJR56600.1 hypothetical protein [Acaryochloris sp. CRU_2_0]